MITSPAHAWTGFTLTCLIASRNLIDVTFCSSPCFSTANLPFHCQQHWVISAKTRTDASFLDPLINSGWRVSWNLAQRDQLFSWSSSSHLVVVLLSWRWGDTFRILHMLHVDATPLLVVAPPPVVAKFFRSLAVRQGRCQPHFSVLDWDFSKLFEHNEMVTQQKMRWVLQLDMNLIAKSTCLIEFNIYKDQKRFEHTLQGTNISHLGKRKIIFESALGWDMLVPRRVHLNAYFMPDKTFCFTTMTRVPKSWALHPLGSHDSTGFSLSSLPALPKFLFLTWVWLFAWVNKKKHQTKNPKPSNIWSLHQFPFKPTSSYIQPCHSIQVALSGSDPKLKQRDLPWFQPWTKPTTRSGFKAWTVIRPAKIRINCGVMTWNDMESQQHLQ